MDLSSLVSQEEYDLLRDKSGVSVESGVTSKLSPHSDSIHDSSSSQSVLNAQLSQSSENLLVSSDESTDRPFSADVNSPASPKDCKNSPFTSPFVFESPVASSFASEAKSQFSPQAISFPSSPAVSAPKTFDYRAPLLPESPLRPLFASFAAPASPDLPPKKLSFGMVATSEITDRHPRSEYSRILDSIREMPFGYLSQPDQHFRLQFILWAGAVERMFFTVSKRLDSHGDAFREWREEQEREIEELEKESIISEEGMAAIYRKSVGEFLDRVTERMSALEEQVASLTQSRLHETHNTERIQSLNKQINSLEEAQKRALSESAGLKERAAALETELAQMKKSVVTASKASEDIGVSLRKEFAVLSDLVSQVHHHPAPIPAPSTPVVFQPPGESVSPPPPNRSPHGLFPFNLIDPFTIVVKGGNDLDSGHVEKEASNRGKVVRTVVHRTSRQTIVFIKFADPYKAQELIASASSWLPSGLSAEACHLRQPR